MKTKTKTIILLAMLSALAQASVPVSWDVDVSRTVPASIDAFRGETLALEATLKRGSNALSTGAATALFLWQTNGMGSAWWSTNATCSAYGVARASFTPSMDAGSDRVRFFFQVTSGGGSLYRAWGNITFRDSPGETPTTATLPDPGGTLNLSDVTVLNAPWATLEAVESSLEPVEASVEAVRTTATNNTARISALENAPDVDLSPYATKTYASDAATNAVRNAVAPIETRLATAETRVTNNTARISALENAPGADLSPYATKTYASDAATDAVRNAVAPIATRLATAETRVTNNTARISALREDTEDAVEYLQSKILGLHMAAATTNRATGVWNYDYTQFTDGTGCVWNAYWHPSTNWVNAQSGVVWRYNGMNGSSPHWLTDVVLTNIQGNTGIGRMDVTNQDGQTWCNIYVSGYPEYKDYNQMPTWPTNTIYSQGGMAFSNMTLVAQVAETATFTYATRVAYTNEISSGGGGGMTQAQVDARIQSATNALTASDVGAMASDAKIKALYNAGETQYISGDKVVHKGCSAWVGTKKDPTWSYDPSLRWFNTIEEAKASTMLGTESEWEGPGWYENAGSGPGISRMSTDASATTIDGSFATWTRTETTETLATFTDATNAANYAVASTVTNTCPAFSNAVVAVVGSGGSPSAPVTDAVISYHADGTAVTVSVGASGTLSADVTDWTEGQTQTALVTLASGASVSPSLILVGYTTWPTGRQFIAACIRVGSKVYVNPVASVQ